MPMIRPERTGIEGDVYAKTAMICNACSEYTKITDFNDALPSLKNLIRKTVWSKWTEDADYTYVLQHT